MKDFHRLFYMWSGATTGACALAWQRGDWPGLAIMITVSGSLYALGVISEVKQYGEPK